MSVQPAETKFYDEGGVTITNARAVLGDTTYPLVNISSVGVGRHVPSSTPFILLLLCALASSICLFAAESRIIGVVAIGVFVLLAWLASRNNMPT